MLDAGDEVVSALDNLNFDEDPNNLVNSSLRDVVHHTAAEFVLETSTFGKEIEHKDELGLPAFVDCTLHKTVVNLGLSASTGQNLNKLTDSKAYNLMYKLDFQIDAKVNEWKHRKAELHMHRDEPSGQAELRGIENYFLDAQAVISRITLS